MNTVLIGSVLLTALRYGVCAINSTWVKGFVLLIALYKFEQQGTRPFVV